MMLDNQNNEVDEKDCLFDLNAVEMRVLACLVEKELTTPDQYPLTENSIKLACNQKSNREPVMKIESGEIVRTLNSLEQKEWVKVDHGSRANKYRHCMRTKLGVDKAQSAILSVLCLRGAQTLSELKTRTERALNHDQEAFDIGLGDLLSRRTPYVRLLEKQAGQREERYMQLLFEQNIVVNKTANSTVAQTVEVQNLDEKRLQELEQKYANLLARVELLEQQLKLSD